MSWKVLITAPAMAHSGEQAIELLRNSSCQLVIPNVNGFDSVTPLANWLADCDAAIAGLDEYSRDVLVSPAAKQLKIISRWGIGVDSIDVATATELGIIVCNTPGILDHAVADYTFGLLLALARQIHTGHERMSRGEWKQVLGCDVHGKTLGLIGCGRIGRAVAQRAKGFGLRVLATDSAGVSPAGSEQIDFVSLDQLLAESDFVSLHTSLTPVTIGMMNEAQFRKMKPSALFINTARGALVNEAALSRALREGWIAGAALDVFTAEPLPAGHVLRSAPNLLLTPHQASFARETSERVSLAATRAIVDLLNGLRPQHVVNPEVFDRASLRASLQK